MPGWVLTLLKKYSQWLKASVERNRTNSNQYKSSTGTNVLACIKEVSSKFWRLNWLCCWYLTWNCLKSNEFLHFMLVVVLLCISRAFFSANSLKHKQHLNAMDCLHSLERHFWESRNFKINHVINLTDPWQLSAGSDRVFNRVKREE